MKEKQRPEVFNQISTSWASVREGVGPALGKGYFMLSKWCQISFESCSEWLTEDNQAGSPPQQSKDTSKSLVWTTPEVSPGSGPGLEATQQWVPQHLPPPQNGARSAGLQPQADPEGRGGENWFTTEAVGRAFPSQTVAVVNNHPQLFLCWAFPFFLPFPSSPVYFFARGKRLCTYSQVPFQKVSQASENKQWTWFGQTWLTFHLPQECLQEPSQSVAMTNQRGRNAILNSHGWGHPPEAIISNTNQTQTRPPSLPQPLGLSFCHVWLPDHSPLGTSPLGVS